jgi:hypothetical protein
LQPIILSGIEDRNANVANSSDSFRGVARGFVWLGDGDADRAGWDFALELERAAILMLLPSPRFGFGFSEARLLPTVLFVFIETIANVLVYAFLFSAPVALIVGIRALASGRSRNGSSNCPLIARR